MTAHNEGGRRTIVLNKPLAWVVPQAGSQEGEVYPIEPGSTLGSGDQAHIRLSHPGVAQVHAELTFADGRWSLRAIGSATKVSDRAVTSGAHATLADGEPIDLGTLRLIFKRL